MRTAKAAIGASQPAVLLEPLGLFAGTVGTVGTVCEEEEADGVGFWGFFGAVTRHLTKLKFPRFRGHPDICVPGVHHVEETPSLSA
jgi:hypothetical protein